MTEKKYHRFDVSYDELNLLQELLQVEILIQTILAIKNTTTHDGFDKLDKDYLNKFSVADQALSAKAMKVLRLFEDYRAFDDNLLDLKAIFIKSNKNTTQLFAVIMSKLQLEFYRSLLTVTSKEEGALLPLLQQKVAQLGETLLSRMDMGLNKPYSRDEANALYDNYKAGGTLDPQQPAPAQSKSEDKNNLKDGLQINILGKKGLA